MNVIQVALDVPLPRAFDYLCEDAGPDDIGRLVVVPFGARRTVGVVIGVSGSSSLPSDKLKAAHELRRDSPPLPAQYLELGRFCSQYYQKPLGEVLLGALPARMRRVQQRSRKRRANAPAQPVPMEAASPAAARHALNEEQLAAYRQTREAFGAFRVFLLFGITGSGKTEIYLQLIADCLREGRQALVLVPEIALTPALEAAFRNRFPHARLAVQHSGMAEAERARGWNDAQSGEAQIVLGTRLAIFVPLARLGIVVVDEEQDASFKQRDGLRYSARDLAVFRARQAGAPVLLVSATPSLETLHHAREGRYRLLRLSRRAHGQARLPTVRLLDCRDAKLDEGLSAPLLAALGSRLARSEQSLVFLNRRGYAPVLACNHCGWVSGCPRCSACLVVHLREQALRCHHCGREEPIPRACPGCGNVELVPFGRGTQRLESALAARFPQARVLRIDSDSARRRPAGWIDQVHAGEADILVGTQMLAKGHHFERVTLVGVVNADAGLFSADYRAPERLFAQLEQVAGRAGRAELPGEVMIQTRFPEHALYRALEAHDYEGYAASLLEDRRRAGFPPFLYEAALRAEADRMEDALGFLRQALALAPGERDGVLLYDPAPASLARLAARERAQLVLQSPARPALQRFLAAWSAALYEARRPRVRWHFDVDPIEF